MPLVMSIVASCWWTTPADILLAELLVAPLDVDPHAAKPRLKTAQPASAKTPDAASLKPTPTISSDVTAHRAVTCACLQQSPPKSRADYAPPGALPKMLLP